MWRSWMSPVKILIWKWIHFLNKCLPPLMRGRRMAWCCASCLLGKLFVVSATLCKMTYMYIHMYMYMKYKIHGSTVQHYYWQLSMCESQRCVYTVHVHVRVHVYMHLPLCACVHVCTPLTLSFLLSEDYSLVLDKQCDCVDVIPVYSDCLELPCKGLCCTCTCTCVHVHMYTVY